MEFLKNIFENLKNYIDVIAAIFGLVIPLFKLGRDNYLVKIPSKNNQL